jgi:hypothetical protein
MAVSIHIVWPAAIADTATCKLVSYQLGGKQEETISRSQYQSVGDYTYEAALAPGLYDLQIIGYGSIPFVYHTQDSVLLYPTVQTLNNYTVSTTDLEQKALGQYLDYYTQYVGLLEEAEQQLKTVWSSDGLPAALQMFKPKYVALRKGMNSRMDSIQVRYSSTYTSEYLVPMLTVGVDMPDTADLFEHLRASYFTAWHLDAASFHNPIADKELQHYFKFFATSAGSMYDGLSFLFTHNDVLQDKVASDALIEYVSNLLLEQHHPQAEDHIVYLYENFAGGCGDHSITDGPLNLGQRIENTQKGKLLPAMQFEYYGDSDKSISVGKGVTKTKPTVLYFWKSTCAYCTSSAPDLEKLAKSYSAEMEVLAVSLDKDYSHLEGYLTHVGKQADRYRSQHVIDCWEKRNFNSEQIQQIYVSSTPMYLFLDKEGIIRFKTNNSAQLKEFLEIYSF